MSITKPSLVSLKLFFCNSLSNSASSSADSWSCTARLGSCKPRPLMKQLTAAVATSWSLTLSWTSRQHLLIAHGLLHLRRAPQVQGKRKHSGFGLRSLRKLVLIRHRQQLHKVQPAFRSLGSLSSSFAFPLTTRSGQRALHTNGSHFSCRKRPRYQLAKDLPSDSSACLHKFLSPLAVPAFLLEGLGGLHAFPITLLHKTMYALIYSLMSHT